MLKLLKAKVMGSSASQSAVVPSFHEKPSSKQAAVAAIVRDACVPHDFDIINIDSLSSSSATSITTEQTVSDDTSVDVDKSYALSYRSAAAAKEYTLVKTINVGSTAKVQLAYHIGTSRHVALKIMKKSKQHVKYMNREVSIHKQLCHENIVQLYDVIETPYHFVLALEYLNGGDLFDLVPPNKGCTEHQALIYMQQLVQAVAHMHARNVVHRDIKPENCVCDSDGVLKLIDFGAASAADGAFTPAGTIPYMAPEMFQAEAQHAQGHSVKYDLKAIDMWAVGVVYFTLLTGRFPWAVACGNRSPEYADYMRDNLKHRYPWFKLSSASLHLLEGLLCPDPAERLTVYEATAMVDALLLRAGLEQHNSNDTTATNKRPAAATAKQQNHRHQHEHHHHHRRPQHMSEDLQPDAVVPHDGAMCKAA